ncbi:MULTISPECIES: pseudaminic acid synthase [unclassified Herbaspirillum]|uniref:pseudaminic acid synthase n=1 Tax=unclassified Herbaspirillum TaxID=2624150 RepID=UPI001152F972|nr:MULTISPECIES: pseudaminic acid synthase [unclassified Herbaspirillum]MBB5392533.1 N-acetylneuraminate synthase [Herbaspirillum sp. SJZ102]TQK06170.1 N-acetylneuraminate synthase [Herbaspirillum sp. SJZ130]TQK12352.1 N-acetylneuraminate synthase [Herbaspirillum sp. SJZ106]
MTFEINGRKIGADHPPYIIAELSANHNGSLERALETIDAAKRCGASAIKLQTYTAETMTIDCDRPDFMVKGGLWDGFKLYDLYKWAQTPFEWHDAMFAHARKIGIDVFSTPFDESAVDLLEQLDTPVYKIASFENTDLPLIRYVAKTGKPMIMSTGMATEAEIAEAVDAARSAGCKDLVLLHCISSYPAPMDQANIRQMQELARRFGTIPGLSDHTIGTTASVAAVALGACVIEKHFTLSRTDKGPDSEFSIEPAELERLCSETHNAWLALGNVGYERQSAEAGSKVFRRSVYFVRDLPAGAVVDAKDIRRIRPGMGLAPKHFDTLIGKRLKVSVARGTATSWDQFDE